MKHFIKKYLKNTRGMSLIEVLVASVIFSFVLLSFGYIFALGQGLVGGQGERRVALNLARESLERIKSPGTNAITGVNAFRTLETDLTNAASAYQWTKSNLTWSSVIEIIDVHNRSLTVSYVNDLNDQLNTPVALSNTLRVTVTVNHSYSTESTYAPVVLSTIITRP